MPAQAEAHAYGGKVTGHYDRATAVAVGRFQRSIGLADPPGRQGDLGRSARGRQPRCSSVAQTPIACAVCSAPSPPRWRKERVGSSPERLRR